MNKKTISFRVYQANRLEQRAENQYIAGIIIIESPCSSKEESGYKSLSYDSKARGTTPLQITYALQFQITNLQRFAHASN